MKFFNKLIGRVLFENFLKCYLNEFDTLRNIFINSKRGISTNFVSCYKIKNSSIGDYTYIARNSVINSSNIGKFCSIGPNFMCGWGIHPTNKLSTSPMFYSTLKQNGLTLSETDKIEEFKEINIGNDVFIGMNVCVLDGVNIGDGAIIGAGAVVTKDIPPYAIAVGSPIKIIKYRFGQETIDHLLKIKWWDWEYEKLKIVEKNFDNPHEFIKRYF